MSGIKKKLDPVGNNVPKIYYHVSIGSDDRPEVENRSSPCPVGEASVEIYQMNNETLFCKNRDNLLLNRIIQS